MCEMGCPSWKPLPDDFGNMTLHVCFFQEALTCSVRVRVIVANCGQSKLVCGLVHCGGDMKKGSRVGTMEGDILNVREKRNEREYCGGWWTLHWGKNRVVTMLSDDRTPDKGGGVEQIVRSVHKCDRG